MFAAEKPRRKSRAGKIMKIRIVRQFVKYFALAALFACAVFLSAVIADAQTTRTNKTKRQPPVDAVFSVPCATALRVGLEQVERLHSADIKRRLKGRPSDSGTESLSEKNAFENYLKCRRADTDQKLKKMPSEQRAAVNDYAKTARRIAEMRVNLLYGVQFDERSDDPINYAVSLNAVALVEDYKGELAWVYSLDRDFNQVGNSEDAKRDEKLIGELLERIERIAVEADQADKFAAFKTEIEKTLTEIADSIGTEKRVTTAFLVRLLRMNLADEN